jgi:hypothetical protein
MTSPKGPEKLPHSVPKGKGKFFLGKFDRFLSHGRPEKLPQWKVFSGKFN